MTLMLRSRFVRPVQPHSASSFVVALALLLLPGTANADVAPGPIEFSMFGFVWAVTTLLLGFAIYAIVARIRKSPRDAAPADETPAPGIWKRPLFRRSVAFAGVIAFFGWVAASYWISKENRRSREDERTRLMLEQYEREHPNGK